MQRRDDLGFGSEGNREELNAVPFPRHIWVKCHTLLGRAIPRRSSWIQHLQWIAASDSAWDHATDLAGSDWRSGALPRLGSFARDYRCGIGLTKCRAGCQDNDGGCDQRFHNDPSIAGSPERLARSLTPAHYYRPDGLS